MDFENITQKMKKLGKDTVEEVQKMNEIRQLKRKADTAQKQIEKTYTEIGRKFFRLNSESAPEGFEEYVQTILDQQELIGQLKEQIRAVKGVVLCPSCGMEVPLGERFCSNCGSRMPEEARLGDENGTEDEVVAEVDAEAAETAAEAAGTGAETSEETAEAAAETAEAAAETTEEAAEAAADAEEEADS